MERKTILEPQQRIVFALRSFVSWNWYPFKHKLTISLKVVKVTRFVSFASRPVVTVVAKEPRNGKLGYLRSVLSYFRVFRNHLSSFGGFSWLPLFSHVLAFDARSNAPWPFTRYEYPRRANRACVFFRVLSCLLVSGSEIFPRYILLHRIILRFDESRGCIFKQFPSFFYAVKVFRSLLQRNWERTQKLVRKFTNIFLLNI